MTKVLISYLVFDERRILRASLKKPKLHGGQFAIKVELKVPDTLFRNEPPVASLVIPERAVVMPEIDVWQPTGERPQDG